MSAEALVQKVEIRNQQLAALHEAAMSIAGEVALDKVLRTIVDSARELVEAQYAALGVPSADGHLETFVYSGLTAAEAERIPHLPEGLGLLGALIQEQRPIRLRRISDDPRSVGFPEGHPPMESFLGVPVVAGDEPLGNLYLTNKKNADAFTAADQEIVEMLAAHAAIAIQNARLYEQVGRLAVLEERTRIGMDLHDGIIQSIYAVGLTLESARLALEEEPAEADELLGGAVDALNEAIRDIRNFILDLRPQRFQGDLDEGLARLVREFQANTMVTVQLDARPETVRSLPTGVARALFLTAQEALANVARHAHAEQVTIELEREETAVTMIIEDDGRGFEVATLQEAVGHGLANMRARAEELEGSFDICSEPGQGTTLRLTLPLHF
jgi:signal transduction histidine kinase